MDHCTVTVAETGDLKPLILPALRSAGVAETVKTSGKTHPFPVLGRSWHDIERALDAFYALDTEVTARPNNSGRAHKVLDAHREFLYRSAEFVEAVEKQMRELFDDKRAYRAPSWIDRLLSEECNALKHEGMRLCWVGAAGPIFSVTGYQVRQHVRDEEREAERFHKKVPAYSFALRIRRMMMALYLLSEEAGRKVIDNFGTAVVPDKLNISEALIKTTKIGAVVFPGEKNVPAPKFEIDGQGNLVVASTGGHTIALPKPYQIRSVHAGDGFTRTFSMTQV